MLDAYEPAANRIANTVAVGFVQERERIIRQQQEAIRELSTPVLQVRERLLILPIIGLIDPQRARQLTEQLLRGIRENRGKVAVMDITGVPAIDSAIANRLVQTVEAARLLGATVIVTGLSPEIAQTLVTIGVDLSKMNTVGDLQGGIELAERCSATRSFLSKREPLAVVDLYNRRALNGLRWGRVRRRVATGVVRWRAPHPPWGNNGRSDSQTESHAHRQYPVGAERSRPVTTA